jgi:serine protease Do
VQDLSDDLTGYFGLKEKSGVLVAKVLEGGPADKGQMKDGDIIRQVDNQQVKNVKELLSVVGRIPSGKKIKILVLRDKKEVALDVVVGERPEDIDDLVSEGKESSAWRGISVQEGKNGVTVTDIQPGSAAEDSGIVAGDVIKEINKQPVKSAGDFSKITKLANGDCLVRTGRGFFVVKAEAKE